MAITERKKALYLTIQQKYEVAKYCIEHKGVTQDQTGKFTVFRVIPSKLAIEVNDCLAIDGITGHHVSDSIYFYNVVAELTNNLPTIPLTSSVQEDILTAEVQRLKMELATSQAELMKAAGIINNYKERFVQIRKLAAA